MYFVQLLSLEFHSVHLPYSPDFNLAALQALHGNVHLAPNVFSYTFWSKSLRFHSQNVNDPMEIVVAVPTVLLSDDYKT